MREMNREVEQKKRKGQTFKQMVRREVTQNRFRLVGKSKERGKIKDEVTCKQVNRTKERKKENQRS